MMRTSDISLRQRIVSMRWLIFLIWILGIVAYQLVIAKWVHDQISENFHYVVEILFYGSLGPVLAIGFFSLIDKWLSQMEQIEHKARTMESRLASIASISADAIISLDQQGKILAWNPGAENLFGFMEDEVLGEPFSELLGGSQAGEVEYQWIEDMVQRMGYLSGHESTCYDSSMTEVHVELTAIPLAGESGEPSGMLIILRDIGSRKRREEEIRRLNESLNEQVAARTKELAEKIEQLARANADLQKLDQMRTEFVSLVSHQLRAPLTNISGAVERIRTGCNLSSQKCIRMLDILDQQTARLDRLVEGVLNTARIEAGELTFHPEPVSILPLLQQVVDEFCARQVGRDVHITRIPGLPLAYADRDRVAEVVTNLLDNADKYSPAGQNIIMAVRADQTEITVSIRDKGSGIPVESIDRIFEKFYRLDSSDSQYAYGYGLGLYLCRQMVEAQGGRIWVENHREGGAVFSFSLPVWQESS